MNFCTFAVSSSNSTLSVEIEAKPDDTSKSNTTKDKGLSKENTKKEMVDESKPEKKSVQLKPKSIDKTRDRVDGKIGKFLINKTAFSARVLRL